MAINQADRPNLLRLDGNLKISATVASDVSHSITRINTSQCSGDAFNGSAEIIATKGDGPIFEVYKSLQIDPIKLHNQDPRVSEFNNNVYKKLQVQTAVSVILEQLSGLSKEISNIQQSSMTLRKPCHAMTHDLVGDISQSLQPACDMQDCHSVTTAELYTLPPTSIRNVQGSNGVNTRQHEKAGCHRQQSSNKIAHSFTNMHCDPSSCVPYDDSGVPVVDENTSITDEDIVTEYIASNSDEAMELQSNPAYVTLDDIISEDHLYEDIF